MLLLKSIDKKSMLEKLLGIFPEKWLLSKCKNCSLVRLKLVGNIWPLKLLYDSFKYVKEEHLIVKCSGIAPEKKLLDKSKAFKETKF